MQVSISATVAGSVPASFYALHTTKDMTGASFSPVIAGKSLRFRIPFGLYGVALFFIVLLPFQQLSAAQYELSHPGQEVSPLVLGLPQYLVGFLIFVVLLFLPRMLGRFDSAYLRAFGSAIFFWLAAIPTCLLSLPNGILWNEGEYGGASLLLFLFGGLLGVVDGLYANPPLSTSLAMPVGISNRELRDTRRQLIREDQERWWKGLSLFTPIIIALMVTAAIAWLTLPLPEGVVADEKASYMRMLKKSRNRIGCHPELVSASETLKQVQGDKTRFFSNLYMLKRGIQLAWVEGTALAGALIIIVNLIGRINRMHCLLEEDYLKLVDQSGREMEQSAPVEVEKGDKSS